MIEFNIDDHLGRTSTDLTEVIANLVQASLESKVSTNAIYDTLRDELEKAITTHETMAERAKELRMMLSRHADPTNYYSPGGTDYLNFNSPFTPDYGQADPLYRPASSDTISF